MSTKRNLTDYKIALIGAFLLLACIGAIVALHLAVDRNHVLFTPLNSILGGFAATFIVSIIYDRFVRGDGREDWLNMVTEAVDKVVSNRMKIHAAGLNAIHPKFNSEAFEDFASRAAKIMILQTYDPQLASLSTVILGALARDAVIQIALISPRSPFIDTRFPELHTSKEAYLGQIKDNVERIKKWAQQRKGRGKLEVRLYEGAPGICLYATDEVAFCGTYLTELDAIATPYFEIAAKSEWYKIYINHFNNIWERAQAADAAAFDPSPAPYVGEPRLSASKP